MPVMKQSDKIFNVFVKVIIGPTLTKVNDMRAILVDYP